MDQHQKQWKISPKKYSYTTEIKKIPPLHPSYNPVETYKNCTPATHQPEKKIKDIPHIQQQVSLQ